MTKHSIEVITSVERRRRWSREDKERLVAACRKPPARAFNELCSCDLSLPRKSPELKGCIKWAPAAGIKAPTIDILYRE